MILFRCDGVPVPQGSKKIGRDRRTHKPRVIDDVGPKLKRWRHAVGWAAKYELMRLRLYGEPSKRAVFVGLQFRFKPTGKHAKRQLEHPEGIEWQDVHMTKPDVDKLVRAVLDALTGFLWKDDCQVVGVLAEKYWSRTPGVTVFAEEWKGSVFDKLVAA